MGNLIEVLPTDWAERARQELAPKPVEEQIILKMAEAGVIAPSDPIVIDGELHRYKTDGKDKSGWYIFFPDNIVAGSFGDWKSGVELNFCANVGREITASELEDQKRRIALAREARATKKARQHKEVAESVGEIWNKAQPASEKHPYLDRKGIPSHGTKVANDGRLMLPMYNAQGIIMSLEYITGAGEKRRHTNGEVKGNFWCIGAPENTGTIYISEGFANAAVIHEAMNSACFISYGAYNLLAVADFIRSEMPNASIVIVADNDKEGTGQKFADKAVMKSGVSMVLMPEVGKDAWDYHQAGHDLQALLDPPVVEKRPSGTEWSNNFENEPAIINWLVDGWWPEKSLIMVYGASGCGKTYYVLDCALRLAGGVDNWSGNEIDEQRTVLYLAGEDYEGVKGKIVAWRQEHDIYDTHLMVNKEIFDLNTQEGYQHVLDEMDAMGGESPDLIIVDTLHCYNSGEENSADGARPMIINCKRLSEHYDCSVLVVHHTGVAGDRARGTTAWKCNLDAEIMVTATDGGFGASQKKNKKTGKRDEALHFSFKDVAINNWFDRRGRQSMNAIVLPAEAPPEKEKYVKPDKNEGYLKSLKGAWDLGDCELLDGQPYITRPTFIRYCEDVEKISNAHANKKASPSDGNRPIGSLILSGIIERKSHGYVLIDEFISGVWMMANKGKADNGQ